MSESFKDFFLCKDTLSQFWDIASKISLEGGRYRVTIKRWSDKRTLPMNSLYWKWLTEISSQIPVCEQYFDSETWHEYFKKHWCPVKIIPLPVGQESIKSTAKLDKGEMSHYLSRIEAWCLDKDVTITNPDDSEYRKLQDIQNG